MFLIVDFYILTKKEYKIAEVVVFEFKNKK